MLGVRPIKPRPRARITPCEGPAFMIYLVCSQPTERSTRKAGSYPGLQCTPTLQASVLSQNNKNRAVSDAVTA